MKPVHTTLLASALIAASYIAVPDSANAGGLECMLQSTTKTAPARQVDWDMDAAIVVARTGRPVRAEVDALEKSVKEEGAASLAFPDMCHIQEMMEHELNDLHARANAFRAREADLLQLQFQIALGRYERAVAAISLAWKNGELPDDLAYKAQYELRVLAFDYVQSLGSVSIRERLQEAIDVLLERGMNAVDRAVAQQELFVKVYTMRIEAALAVLAERSKLGLSTVEDLQRVSDCLVALERLQKFTTPHDCGS